MKTVPAAKFKDQCLALLDEVRRTRLPVVVTRHGKPVAQIGPIMVTGTRGANPLKGSIEHEGDLVTPIDGAWDALR
jgi:prevent-host-death family protein